MPTAMDANVEPPKITQTGPGPPGATAPNVLKPAKIDTGFYYYDASNIDSPEIAAVLYD